MSKKKKPARKGPSSSGASVVRLPVRGEWWLASRELPSDSDAPGVAELFVWAMDDGRLAGAEPIEHGPSFAREVAEATLRVMRTPAVEAAQRPRVLYVARAELVPALRSALGSAVRVVAAPSPTEIESLLDEMLESLHPLPELPEVERALLEPLFRAAAALYELAPWREDVSILLESEDEELDGLLVVLTPGGGNDPGFMVVESAVLGELLDGNDFDPRSEFDGIAVRFCAPSKESRAKVRALRLPLAGPAALPTVLRLNGASVEPPSADDVIVVTTIARALVDLARERAEALREEVPFVHRLTLAHRSRLVEVSMQVGEDDGDDEDDEDEHGERARLLEELESLEEWLDELLEQAGLEELDFVDAVADPAWIHRLPEERRREAARLVERMRLVREHLDEHEEDLGL